MLNTGDRISEARAAAGLSQNELAEKMSVHPQQISMWETGRRRPRPDALRRIADALGVNWEWIRTGSGPMKPIHISTATGSGKTMAFGNMLLDGLREHTRTGDAISNVPPPIDKERLAVCMNAVDQWLSGQNLQVQMTKRAELVGNLYDLAARNLVDLYLAKEGAYPFLSLWLEG